MPLDINFNEHYEMMRQAMGRSIEDPIPVALGTEDENGAKLLKVPDTDTDAPNQYYFHELPNMQEFRGVATNAGAQALNPSVLRYGQPVYVQRDVLTGVWVIVGLVPELGSEYIEGADMNPPVPVTVGQITAGLLDETDPPSMKVRVLGAPYSMGDVFKYIETQESTTQSGVPTTNGRAVYRLVQLNFTTGALSYKTGAEIDALLTHQQAFAIDVAGSIIPQVDPVNFRCGYIKLIAGMTAIRRTANLWQVQEILTKEGLFSGARAQRSTSFNVNNATDTIIDWNTESYDTNTYHDNSTNPSRMTVPKAGYYRLSWKLVLSSTTQWSLDILINGTLNETIIPVTTTGGYGHGMVVKSLTAGQYVQLQTWQNSGSAQTVDADSWFAIEYVGA